MRFPEFTGEWEESTLESFIDIISGIPIQSEDILEEELGIRILRGINITEGVIRHNKEIDRYYAKPITDKIQKFVLEEKDLVLGMDGSKLGKNVALISKPDVGSILIQRVARIKALKNADIDFIFQKIYSNKFQRYVDVVNTSSGIPHISLQQIKDFETCFPVTLSEQTKIASFLSLIDKRIATQNKIIEQYKSLIKGIYTYLLGESDKYRKLGELCQIKKGEQINRTELLDDDKYYVMNGGITPSGFYHSYNTKANTISISEGGNSCGYVQYNDVPFWSGGHCYTLDDIDKDIDDRYLFHYLKANEPQIMALRIGSGLPNIQKKDLSHFCIPMPSLLNQKEISDTLDKIILKIELTLFVIARVIHCGLPE